jgi:hypothetical protein
MLKQKWFWCFFTGVIIFLLFLYLNSTAFFKGSFEDIGALITLIIIEFALIGAGLADLIVSIIQPKKDNKNNRS